jgi:hypothetical protein
MSVTNPSSQNRENPVLLVDSADLGSCFEFLTLADISVLYHPRRLRADHKIW